MKEKKYTIFIIDKDLEHGNQIKNHLAKHSHYTFLLFSTPEECIEYMQLEPALIFLDYELQPSGKQSSEVLKDLKKIAPSAEVVLFTGKESIEVIEDSMHNGAYDYYIKDNHAHLKAEYLIIQILHKHQLKEKIAQQKDVIKLLLFFIAALICMAIAMYFTGFINDSYIGGSMFD
ncbi:response regulator [Cytophaga aurantiaca]|uniref:response regulator n=1 Tax=Cytophaga aurantiaca TaxID=29530 RepID=UPI0003688BC2|nr:response regulator [Cytophaga aurantiaca]